MLTALLVGMTVTGAAMSWHAPVDGPPGGLSAYDVVWTTPGPDAAASMPIGNGAVGANVWTEPNGDVVFYVSRPDAWSEASRLLKLGRVRVSLSNGVVRPGQAFRQELDLAHGCIRFTGGPRETPVMLTLFVDPEFPEVRLIGSVPDATDVRVSLEMWRTERKRLSGSGPDAELTSSWMMHDAPASIEVWESADAVLDDPREIVWVHRNDSSVMPLSVRHQGLEAVAGTFADPLKNRTFGGAIRASGDAAFVKESPISLRSSAPVRSFTIGVRTACSMAPSVDAWRSGLARSGRADADAERARDACAAWWGEFWGRSWIFVNGDRASGHVPRNAHPVTLGQDSAGGNRFDGEFGAVGMYPRAMDAAWVAGRAEQRASKIPAIEKQWLISFAPGALVGSVAHDAMSFDDGFTIEAWVKPSKKLAAARIIDKITPGGTDGFLFDVQPFGTLRLIVGTHTLTVPGAVALGEWSHVAATFDAASERLCVYVNGKEVGASASADAGPISLVTRGYVLQRWVQACGWGGPMSDDGAAGVFPTKFNGSIFTVDAAYTNGQPTSPDYRRWGDCFWWQNTRLAYHPMLASGDLEMMEPLFRFYERMAPACAARARAYHGVGGVYFPETVGLNGLYSNGDYGWNREGHAANEVLCPWWQWAWNQATELVSLMLDRYEYAPDERFASERLVPMASAALRYFDARFARDANGVLAITPTQSLETYWKDVVNDMPCVAGLHDVLPRLLALPRSVASDDERALWERLRAALPPIPTRVVDGVRVHAPAGEFDPARSNCETPELYNVFPHRLVGVTSTTADLAAARETYWRRHDKATHGWTQDGQFAALLGLTDEAAANIVAKSRNSNPKHRFPATWGPNFDWLPDQCHGSNLMHVLQTMLVHPRGDEILLFPAWPKQWDVSFKLHAPRATTVECVYRAGTIETLVVTPAERARDVRIMLGANPQRP